ncbi:MAG: T9SS type A sorting domain-containing protein [Williamsia sp.]|nr:T9SS type A sorting domain-containing protein [Williamsia sp.]
MKVKSLLYLFLLFVSVAGKAQVNQSDSLALVEFYNKTQPKNGSWDRHKNWLTSAPLTDWFGVTVANNRVTQLTLTFNNITGKLPPSFLNLTALKKLNLRGNTALSIALSSNLSKLKNLSYLDLQSTNTTGAIPEQLTSLAKLEYLNLSSCFLTGSLPASIDKLQKLNTLILTLSGLGGTLPAGIGNLPSLQVLYLNNNRFSGTLPAQGYLPSLTQWLVGGNGLSGNLPAWLSGSRQLYYFDIAGNNFSGPIPAAWGDSLKGLRYVYAGYNHLSGAIPEWLLQSPVLDDLELNNNEFSRNDNPCTVLSPSILVYQLENNRYNFNGLECLKPNFGGFGNVSPQAPLKIGTKGKQLTLSAGGTLSNNTYSWYRVGTTQATVIAGDSSFTPTQSGQYYARVTNTAVPRLTLTTDTVTYTAAAKAAELHIAVSPNPTKGQVLLSGLNDKTDALVRVTDLSGHLWLQATSRKQAMITLNVANLKPGTYFIAVSGNGGVKTLSLVKD